MSSTKEMELFGELLRLHARYGGSAFRRLSALLQDTERLDELRSVVETVHKAHGRRSQEKVNPGARNKGVLLGTPTEEIIHEFSADESKFGLLDNFYRDTRNRKILPSIKEARDFATQLGVNLPNGARTRELVVDALVKRLAQMNAEELREAVRIANSPTETGLSLWSKMIIR